MIRQIVGRLKTASKAVTHREYDALDLLRADHMKVEAMAVQLRLMRDVQHRRRLFREIRSLLERHMRFEEDYFYPECEKIHKLRGAIDHARSEHQLVKDALKDLAVMIPSTHRFDALLTKAILSLEDHIIEEENLIFRDVRKFMSPADFRRMSSRMIVAHAEPVRPATRRAA